MSRKWPDLMLRLAVLLRSAPEPTRSKAILLYQSSCDEADLRRKLQPLCATALRDVATALASGLGGRTEELLKFSDPASRQRELVTKDALLCRLDRCWGGMAMLLLKALQPVMLSWHGLQSARLISLRGGMKVDRDELASYASQVIRPGSRLAMSAGALALLRPPPLAAILNAIQEAELPVAAIIAAACEAAVSVHTPLGLLTYQSGKGLATINGRPVRLSAREVAVLEVLLRRPGEPSDRSEINRALGFTATRALDRIMLNLRDKFGDGLFTTLYGTGYMLLTKMP
ncbi:MAG: winged helix-turn-helix domain-containing protein [Terriglobales bacterium]